MGKRSWEKFLPEIYMRASVSDRIAVVQGLTDTDGWTQSNSLGNTSAYFGTSSERLKDNFVEMVEFDSLIWPRCDDAIWPHLLSGSVAVTI